MIFCATAQRPFLFQIEDCIFSFYQILQSFLSVTAVLAYLQYMRNAATRCFRPLETRDSLRRVGFLRHLIIIPSSLPLPHILGYTALIDCRGFYCTYHCLIVGETHDLTGIRKTALDQSEFKITRLSRPSSKRYWPLSHLSEKWTILV